MSFYWHNSLADVPHASKHGQVLVAQETWDKVYRYKVMNMFDIPHGHYLHEGIYRDRPHKFYMDLDGQGYFPPENLLGIIQTIVAAFKRLYDLDIIDHDVLVFSSSNSEKISYHLVVPKFHFTGLCCKKIAQYVARYNRDAAQLMDMSVYASFRLLRIYRMTKRDSNRPKVFLNNHPEYSLRGYPFGGTAGHLEFCILKNSLITYVGESVFGAEEQPPPREPIEGLAGRDELMVLASFVDPNTWSVQYGGQNDTRLSLIRKYPAHCDACERVHENENAFIFMINGVVFFRCFRAEKAVCIQPGQTFSGVSLPALPARETTSRSRTPMKNTAIDTTKAINIGRTRVPRTSVTPKALGPNHRHVHGQRLC